MNVNVSECNYKYVPNEMTIKKLLVGNILKAIGTAGKIDWHCFIDRPNVVKYYSVENILHHFAMSLKNIM